jgi:hypothetical protein
VTGLALEWGIYIVLENLEFKIRKTSFKFSFILLPSKLKHQLYREFSSAVYSFKDFPAWDNTQISESSCQIVNESSLPDMK